jgi:predicted Rossmann fold nucleotide-binding protein DprA/Smf involved in DNA uptake
MAANFPRRNRIISGLSLTVLVVEAGVSSGALITARHAIDDHLREPCALPGPVDSARSAGCNAAIRDGWAHAVLDPEDMLRLLDGNAERMGRAAFVRPDLEALGLPEELRAPVVRAAEVMARRPRIGIDDLASTLQVDASRARIVRTFAQMLLAQVGAARTSRARALRTVVEAPRASVRGETRGGTAADVSPELQLTQVGTEPSADQVQPMA